MRDPKEDRKTDMIGRLPNLIRSLRAYPSLHCTLSMFCFFAFYFNSLIFKEQVRVGYVDGLQNERLMAWQSGQHFHLVRGIILIILVLEKSLNFDGSGPE